MAGETDGKPRDPVDGDAVSGPAPAAGGEVVSGENGRPGGRRARAAARREAATIELEASTVAEAASTVEPEDPRVAAVEMAATENPAPPVAPPDGDLPPVPHPYGYPDATLAAANGDAPAAAASAPTGPDDVARDPDRDEAPKSLSDAAAEPIPGSRPDPEAPQAAPVEPVRADPPPPRTRNPGVGAPLGLGLVGGVLGAGLVVLVMTLVGPGAETPDRLTALETAVGDRATRRTAEALEKRAQAAEAALQALRTDLSALGARPQVAPGDVTMLGQRIDRLDRAVAQLAARPAAPGDAAAQAPVALPPVVVAGRESAALAVAMLIRDAVSRGTPFARELAALEAGGGDAALVARLKPFATTGAPQAPALASAFAPQAAALARVQDPGPSAGVVDRVTALIGGAVRVRPVGEPAGEKPGAVGARAETALKRGDLAAALKDLETLPADARAPVQPFIDRLRARLAAGQAADSLVAAAVEQVIAATASSGVPTR